MRSVFMMTEDLHTEEIMMRVLTSELWEFELTPPQPIIREAIAEDMHKLLDYVITIASEPYNNTRLRAGSIPRTASAYRNIITEYTNQPNSLYLVADMGDVIAGHLRLTGNTDPVTRHTVDMHVNVHPDYRGIGIGSALIDEGLRWARNHGSIRRVELHVLARNESAISLYQRHGFEIEGLCRAAYRMYDEDGSLVDALIMAQLI
jgi:ribosomal protein S18 acetylase RimI-like enzyme